MRRERFLWTASSLASAQSVAEQMTERLQAADSGSGAAVSRGHEHGRQRGDSLSLAADRSGDVAGVPITTAAVRYTVADGTPENELCWYGDETFVNHLWKVLGVGGFRGGLCVWRAAGLYGPAQGRGCDAR